MMDLQSTIPNYELKEVPRFDFLKGVRKFVQRIDEVHPSADNDTHYIFMIWVHPDNHDTVEEMIRRNVHHFGDPQWTSRIVPDTGAGLIIFNTHL